MSKTRSIWLGVAVLCIAALGVNWYLRTNTQQVFEQANADAESRPATEPLAISLNKESTNTESDFSLEQSSLRGTEVDGSVLLNAHGKVVLDPGMRRLFDYYLSLIGERDLIQIRTLLKIICSANTVRPMWILCCTILTATPITLLR